LNQNSSECIIEYDDNRRKNRTWHIPIKDNLRDHCIAFEDYGDMISQLRYCRDNIDRTYEKRLKVYQFAKENLIWEKYDQNIFDAYKLA